MDMDAHGFTVSVLCFYDAEIFDLPGGCFPQLFEEIFQFLQRFYFIFRFLRKCQRCEQILIRKVRQEQQPELFAAVPVIQLFLCFP